MKNEKKRVSVLLAVLVCICVQVCAITPKLPVLYAPKFIKFNGQLGRDGTVAMEYDSRFKEGSNFGYNVGLGYGYSKIGNTHWESSRYAPVHPYNEQKGKYTILTVPLYVYYLHLVMGRSSFFETSAGVNLFVSDFYYSAAKSHVGYFPSARFSYRYESMSFPGILVLGVNVNVKTPGAGLRNTIGMIPYLSLGIRL